MHEAFLDGGLTLHIKLSGRAKVNSFGSLTSSRFGTLKNLTLSLIIPEHSFSFEKCSQIGVSMFRASLVHSGQGSDFLVLSDPSVQLRGKSKQNDIILNEHLAHKQVSSPRYYENWILTSNTIFPRIWWSKYRCDKINHVAGARAGCTLLEGIADTT